MKFALVWNAVRVKGYEVQVGDLIEVFEIHEVQRTL
ncbi:Uncharacterised protein [Moraxella atlantae]|uniref:Uncharacterized protein n=1 Tax=Faucicola atlantae TaxID=34059 RepID=A0A378QNA6_9GAMM|nr:Uncharacterised protein [Moraxella atlantae]